MNLLPGPAFQSETRYEKQGDGVKVTIRKVDGNGRQVRAGAASSVLAPAADRRCAGTRRSRAIDLPRAPEQRSQHRCALSLSRQTLVLTLAHQLLTRVD
jgi:hypothetical protein